MGATVVKNKLIESLKALLSLAIIILVIGAIKGATEDSKISNNAISYPMEAAPKPITLPRAQAEVIAKMMWEDFFGKYPELNTPAARPLVGYVGMQIAKELGKTDYDAEFRDETARRVKAIIAKQESYEAVKINRAKQVFEDDFYGHYPELNNPSDRAIVSTVAPSIIRDSKSKDWTPELRDKIAVQVKQISSGVDSFSKKHSSAPVKEGYGTGFLVSHDGHILTNSHVASGCNKLFATLGRKRHAATLVADNAGVDLALVKIVGEDFSPAVFRKGRVRVGEDVVVAGFPLTGILSPELNIAKGNISALAGVDGDKQEMQISAPLQPGNSGSPVLDASGNVVGIAVAEFNVKTAIKTYGGIPQNVNFAVNQQPIEHFLGEHSVEITAEESGAVLPTVAIADKAAGYTVVMECQG